MYIIYVCLHIISPQKKKINPFWKKYSLKMNFIPFFEGEYETEILRKSHLQKENRSENLGKRP